MSSSSSPPVIAFELGVGEFKILTPEAVYLINVCRNLVDASSNNEIKNTSGPNGQGDDKEIFFREISEELFDKIGHLARKLSVSVEELPLHLDVPNFSETDHQLESAKDQLEEVVKITEKASMTIMDTADQIQTDMNQLKKQLESLQNLDLVSSGVGNSGDGGGGISGSENVGGGTQQEFFAKLEEIKKLLTVSQKDEEKKREDKVSEVSGGGNEVVFDIDVVFQTLYELCTNESVKEHIKNMRQDQADFDGQMLYKQLASLASTVDEEDGFYNFPITEVLKTLYAATSSEDYRNTLKKMNQTASGIFLDSVLPIEGQKKENNAPLEVEDTEVENKVEENADLDLPSLRALFSDLESLAQGQFQEDKYFEFSEEEEGNTVAKAEVQSNPGSSLYTAILTKDRDTIIQTANAAHELINATHTRLNRILETLSFQDLSGQRILKVVSMINDAQTQLISILVSANTKLKAHQSGDLQRAAGNADEMAQKEVNKALEKLSGGSATALNGPSAEVRLDQDAVNNLLAQMGF